MKIRERETRVVERDIELDSTIEADATARVKRGMKTACASCGDDIPAGPFVIGFKAGHKNMALHVRCASGEARKEKGE